MSRREFPTKVKAAAFARSGGRCESCTARLYPGKFAYDHDNPDGLTGEPTLANCVVLCSACHSIKTRTKDVPNIARAKRREAKHIGAKPRSQRAFRKPAGVEFNWKSRRYERTTT